MNAEWRPVPHLRALLPPLNNHRISGSASARAQPSARVLSRKHLYHLLLGAKSLSATLPPSLNALHSTSTLAFHHSLAPPQSAPCAPDQVRGAHVLAARPPTCIRGVPPHALVPGKWPGEGLGAATQHPHTPGWGQVTSLPSQIVVPGAAPTASTITDCAHASPCPDCHGPKLTGSRVCV
jgi:hypothetical protein